MIKRGLSELDGLPLNIHIHDYNLPSWAIWWQKGMRGMHFHYLLWQWYAYRYARKLHAIIGFDLVHHITFGVYRHPSFMGGLGIPFIFGPIGGGEYLPPEFLHAAPWNARIYEFLRSAANRIATIDPLVRNTFRQASLILCKTQETMAAVPTNMQNKCICLLEVGIDPELLAQSPSAGSERPQFLFAGRLIYWKGIHLIFQALKRVRQDVPCATLTVVGVGSDRVWLQSVAQHCGVDDAVEWLGWVPQERLIQLYGRYTAFIFPSLHDSSGNVVVEAIAQGVPVVCLDVGGPAAILPDNCGFKIPARDHTEEEVIAALVASMKQLACDGDLRRELAGNALAAARRQTWQAVVGHAYSEIDNVLVTGRVNVPRS
jgi:glycosyltransferase involved in cell wall biosynthesis